MFSYRWFENNFSYPANQPKRNKKRKKKKQAAAVSGASELRLGRSSPA